MVLGNEFYFVCVYYLGKGTNLLYIKGILGNLSDVIQIEDLYKYDPLTTDKGFFTVCSNAVLSYSEQNNLTITGVSGYQSNYGSVIHSEEILLDDFEVNYKMYMTNANRVFVGLRPASGNCGITQEANFLRDYNSNTTHYSKNVFPQNTWFDVKIVYENGVVTATINGNTSSSVTIADAKYLAFGFWFESRTIRIKDLKIKTL